MSQFQSMSADAIVKHFMEAGVVEPEAVEALEKRINSDWVISADEAEMLFQINQKVGDHDDHCPNWGDFYVHAITRYVVNDMNTPGEISNEEAEWIRKHIHADGNLTQNEVKLLRHIKKCTTSYCDSMKPLFDSADRMDG